MVFSDEIILALGARLKRRSLSVTKYVGGFFEGKKYLHPRLFCRERIWNMTLAIIGAINAHLRLRAPELRNPGIFYLSADDIGLPNSWVISPIAMPFNVHVMGTAPILRRSL